MKIFSYTTTMVVLGLIALMSCKTGTKPVEKTVETQKNAIKIEAENYTDTVIKGKIESGESDLKYVTTSAAGVLSFDVNVPEAGRYQARINAKANGEQPVICWIEDYYDNPDDRTYNITGNIVFETNASGFTENGVDGTPLNKGLHKMRIHFNQPASIDWFGFNLIKPNDVTPVTLTQKMDGKDWSLVWSDEFDEPAIDTSKWTFDVGNWGWGNSELEYYTNNDKKNARIEDSNLVIEAIKDSVGDKWTSARLTTRGKVSFKYGKIEFRAKVPANRGNWAAGWTLGDTYQDELSWPYCGEIDILESVGFEMNDTTGNGVAHASVHSRAYYFKIGNQVTAVKNVENMEKEYHTYAVEWTPDYVYILVDGDHYFTYNKPNVENAWPFDTPQDIILNLAMGGGWGGARGMDPTITSQKMIIDYVRVYERK